MALRQRARNDEDKQARRAAILTEAGTLLLEHAYGRITMAQVAAACGLAKGTLYLYFRSKEELFLALLERELLEWFASLRDRLERIAEVDAEVLGREFATSLEHRRLLDPVLPLSQPAAQPQHHRDQRTPHEILPLTLLLPTGAEGV